MFLLMSLWRGSPAVRAHLDGPDPLLVSPSGCDLGLPSCCQQCLWVDGTPNSCFVLILSPEGREQLCAPQLPQHRKNRGAGLCCLSLAADSELSLLLPSACPAVSLNPIQGCSCWNFHPSVSNPRHLLPVSHWTQG